MAGSLGYCGLDRRRQPLAGDEIRACWEAGAARAALTLVAPLPIRPAADGVAERERVEPLEFVEVRAVTTGEPAGATGEPGPLPPGPLVPPIPATGEPGWSLWGELDR